MASSDSRLDWMMAMGVLSWWAASETKRLWA